MTAAGPSRLIRRCLIGLWGLWCVVVVVAYYPKLGHLIAAGPSAWRQVSLTDGSLHGLRSFPALGEALSRTSRGVLGAIGVLMAAHALGALLCAAIRWRSDDWRERLLYHLGAGFFLLSEVSIALAALHLYRRPVVVGLVLVAAIGDAWLARRAWQPDARVRFVDAGRNLLTSRRDAVWKVVIALAMLMALLGALAPEREFDALWWHLDFPRQWLQTGHLIQPRSEYVALFPMSWETIYGAGLALGGQVAAKLVHFACLPLTALIVYQATLRRFPRANPWLAAALLVTTPTVLWEATTAYIDLSGALLIALAGYALFRYVETRSTSWLVMAGITTGMAVASKHLALLALSVLVILLVIGLHRAGVGRASVLRSAGVLAGLSLAAAAPWYLHSWLATGNPVFPEADGIFGAPADRWNAAAEHGLRAFTDRFGMGRTPLHLLTLPWDMTVHGARFGGTFGPLFLVLLPALALARGKPTRWLLAFVVGYLSLWASPLSTFQLRWALPVIPVMAVLGAEAASRLRSVTSSSRRFGPIASTLLTGGLTVLMVLNLPPLTPYQEADRHGDLGWLTHVVRQSPLAVVIGAESEREYLRRAVASSVPWRYLDHHSPEGAFVLTLTDGGDNFLTHRARLPYDAVMAQRAVSMAPVGREHQALTALRRLGISHVLFDRRVLARNGRRSYALASSRALACWYDVNYDDGRFIVARLRWPTLLPTVRTGASPWLNCARNDP